jgi:ATP-dependent exoDNAse (exonuclease V) beta subunit
VSQYHKIFLASAGTGKTFRLSGRYLDLLLANREASSILATTFTRKAAEEILNRVLKRLVEMIDQPGKRKELEGLRDFGEGFEASQALELLAKLARGLNRFDVCTLDSFFNRIAQLYPLELGMPPNWSVALGTEQDELRNEALTRLLDGVGGREQELEFAELLREIASSNGASRGIHFALTELVKWGREVLLDSAPGAWKTVQIPEPADPKKVEGLEKALEGLDVPMTKGKEPKEKKNWSKAHAAILSAVRRKDWKAVVKVGLFRKYIEGEEKFDRHVIDEDWKHVLKDLMHHVAHELLVGLTVRNERAQELLDRYEKILKEVKRERGLYEFADIPRILAPLGDPGEGPLVSGGFDLAYRTDAHLAHLLLDEFQDTSPSQWSVLDGMAEEVSSYHTGEKSFFCVGDSKQSIYGWRSAEPRLLGSLVERLNVLPDSLEENHRSSIVILETVDMVFSDLDSLPVFKPKGKECYLAAATSFREGFKGHTAAKNLPGVAELRQAGPAEEGRPKWEPTIVLAVERVMALHEEFPKASIGVLVRSNKVISPLIARLQARNVLASGEGGNPLTDSAAVLHFLSLLHLADHPSDSLAAFHLKSSPMPEVLGFSGSDWKGKALSRAVRERLSDPGLGRLCASLEEAVREHEGYNDWDRRRYRQLGDLAFAHSGRFGMRADRFVDLVRAHKVEDPAASRIKVMTVHASKGLEFDAVILPELDVPLARNRWPFLTTRPEPRGQFTEVTVNPGKDVVQLPGVGLKKMFDEQSKREVGEALCVLYVGMTRAKYRLEMLVQDTGRSDGGTSAAGILRAALPDQRPEEGVLWRHESSDKAWWKPKEESDEESVHDGESGEDVQPVPPFALAPSVNPRRLPSRAPSSEEGGQTKSGSDLLAPTSTGGTRFGSLIHHLLDGIDWPGIEELDEARLLERAMEVEPDEAERHRAIGYLRKVLTQPEIRAALSPPSDAAEAPTVWHERTFCAVLSDGGVPVLRNGAFDRVILHGSEGGYTDAMIQDYKTDAVTVEDIQDKVDHYAPQLAVYRTALAKMTGLAEENIRAQLLFLNPGLVREVNFSQPQDSPDGGGPEEEGGA